MIFRNINHYVCSVLAIFLAICCSQGFAEESFISREQALAAMFPGSQIHSKTVFLTKAQIEKAQTLSGEEITSALIARYEIFKDENLVARAYVDTHSVRTKKESLLIVLDPERKVLRIEVTASEEPPEYRAAPEWYQQYHGKSLDDDLYVDRAIRPLAGATLTGIAANQAVRRIMAIDKALEHE